MCVREIRVTHVVRMLPLTTVHNSRIIFCAVRVMEMTGRCGRRASADNALQSQGETADSFPNETLKEVADDQDIRRHFEVYRTHLAEERVDPFLSCLCSSFLHQDRYRDVNLYYRPNGSLCEHK